MHVVALKSNDVSLFGSTMTHVQTVKASAVLQALSSADRFEKLLTGMQ
jgi:hypothetical protein